MNFTTRHLEDAARAGMGSFTAEDFWTARSAATTYYGRLALFASTVVLTGMLGFVTL